MLRENSSKWFLIGPVPYSRTRSLHVPFKEWIDASRYNKWKIKWQPVVANACGLFVGGDTGLIRVIGTDGEAN